MKKLANAFLVWLVFFAAVVAVSFAHLDLWLLRAERGAPGETNLRVAIPLLVGVAAVACLFLVNLGRVVAAFRSRRAIVALNVAIMIVLAGGIMVLVNGTAFKHYKTFDWTLKGLFTLSERTEHVVENLPRPVTAHVIAPPYHELYLTVRGTLDMYRAASKGKLEVEYFDPAQDRRRLEAKLNQLGVKPKELEETDVVIFEAPVDGAGLPRTKHVAFRDLVEVDYTGGPHGGSPKPKGLKAEQLFTEAILSVSRAAQTSVYLLTGHQELEVYGREPDERLSKLEEALKKLNYRVESFGFDFAPESGRVEVPADCDVLVIAGPKARFEDREIERLRAYLDRGGRALVLGEPTLRTRPGTRSRFFEDTRLNLLLKDYGIELEPGFIFDPTALVSEVAVFAFAPSVAPTADHEVVKPLAGLRLLFDVAEPLVVTPPAEGTSKVKVRAIVETAPAAIAVRDIDAFDRTGNPFSADHRKGPLALAAAATKEIDPPTATAVPASGEGGGATKKLEARLLVVGDASVATDRVADAWPADADFVLNSIAWLAAREESIAIGSKAPEVIRLRLDEDQKTRVKLMALIELPLLAALMGLGVFLVRRS